MDHGLEFIIPILEILEVEVSSILYNPGNIGKLTFSIFSYPGNIGNLLFLFSHVLKIWAAGGRLQGLGSGGLHFFGEPFSWNFVTCPISGNDTFPRSWSLFGSYLALPGPYFALLGLIGSYWAMTVNQKRNTEGEHKGHRE